MSCARIASFVSAALLWLGASAAYALPDWSGQWETVGITPVASGVIAESLEDNLKRWDKPPFTPEWQKQFDAFLKLIASTPAPARANCTPFGFPMMMLESPFIFEPLITRRETALIFSAREVRHIYTDGRAHRAPEERWPTVWGDAIGHWERDTLVIETVSIVAPAPSPPNTPPVVFVWDRDRFQLIANFSNELKTVERMRLRKDGLLEDQLTFVDPISLTRPWTVVRTYRRVTAIDRIVQDDCTGDERNPVVNGETTLIVR